MAVTDASARSMATMPNCPAWQTRPAALMASSIACTPRSPLGVVRPLWRPRIHNSRERATPAACPDTGSKLSNVSMRATTSPRVVAAASTAHNTLVRPDDEGPIISERCPRTKPPPSSSSRPVSPVEATRSSGIGRFETSVPSSFLERSNDSSSTRSAFIRFFFAHHNVGIFAGQLRYARVSIPWSSLQQRPQPTPVRSMFPRHLRPGSRSFNGLPRRSHTRTFAISGSRRSPRQSARGCNGSLNSGSFSR